ncbi:SpaA isopeptide-forming pilin-related protein [Streptococcus sanguinis]|uniref:SpaA isopeptide-forming pilin-related protein n=1 Tax=Streptococcus sanguinis TaxID=1305 RepID=UPI0039C09000
MNKRIRALLHLIILFLGVILPSLAPLTQVQAAEIGDAITEMSIKNSSGGELTQGVDIWEPFRVYAKFVLPDNQVHQGDTTTIGLPAEYAFANSTAIELKDSSDNVVANGYLDSTNKTITLTYTDYVEQKSGVRGEFFFYARVDHDVVRQEGDLNAGFTVGGRTLYPGIVHYNGPPKKYDSKIEKSSYQYSGDDKNEIRYNIAINRNMENYTDVTVSDKISSPNLSVVPDSIRVYKIAWRWNNGDWVRDSTEDVTANFQSKITENAAGDGFTIDLGDMDGFGYLLDYKTKADYDLVDGERVSNSATMTYNGGQTTTSAENRSYQIAGGVGEGYVFTIKLHKVNENGENLQGAEFEVVRDRSGAVVGKLTTDSNGNANLGDLLRDDYTIREVTPPTGYDKLTEEIKIGSQDFGTDKSVSREIVNKKTVTEQDVTFKKVDPNGKEIPGAQLKIYKGDHVDQEEAPVADWTSEENTSKVIKLSPGTYTLTEANAPAGYQYVEDITFTVGANGTVALVKKGAEDTVQAAGSILTITDKEDNSPKAITFSKVNLGGTEIAGAQIKIFKGNKAQGQAVESWTSEANQSKAINLEPGIYTFHEEAAPTGYLKVTDITFQVKHDGTVEVTNVGEKDSKGENNKVVTDGAILKVTDKDDDSERDVTIKKVDPNGKEIPGAKLKLYKGSQIRPEAKPLAEWTSEANASKVVKLAPGTYSLKESLAPAGFVAVEDIKFTVHSDGTITVDAKGATDSVEANGLVLTVTDKEDNSLKAITFSKVNLGGTEIAGAEIKIYKGDKAEGQAVESWTSEANQPKDINLAPGTYTFHEEAAPTGYLKVTDITFKVKTDGTVEVTNVGEKDAKGESNTVATHGATLTITDKDDDLPRKVTFSKVNLGGTEIAGAQIKIFKGNKAQGQAVESWTSEAGKSKELNLAPGTYTFHEEAAPTGYLKVTDITFQVNHDGTVKVTNVGEKDAKGEANTVATNGSTVTVTDKDDDLPRKVTFSKVNLGGTEIAGAEIKIYKGEKAEGTAVESWTSEANQSKDINLAPGTYTFHEEAAPTGYLKVTDITFQVKQDGTVEVTNVGEKDSKGEENKVVINGSTVTVTDKDDDLPHKVTFSKVNLGGTEIAGAEIKIYKGEKAEGNAVESWTSEAGKSKELNLTPGTYTFHEEAVPTGYLKVTDITFQVKQDGTVEVTNVGEKDSKGEDNKVVTDGSKVTVTDKDDDLPRKVTFSKVNLGGTEIAGAQIKIYKGDKAEGTAVESWTSEAGKSKELNLTPGTYTFHEEAAPTGYLKVTDITFQVKQDGTVEVTNVGEKDSKGEENKVVINGSTVTVTDKDDDLPRKVTFSKINLGGTEIAGAEIQIFQGKEATGNPVAKWTSEANTSHELGLAPGVYTFHEAAAPTGYLAVTDIVFQVNLDGTVTVVNADGNTVEYKDGTLVVTDQTKPTGPDKDPSKKTDEPDPKKSNQDKPIEKDQDKPGDKGKTKKILPFTGTEISFTLLAFGLILIVGCGVYFGIRFKK